MASLPICVKYIVSILKNFSVFFFFEKKRIFLIFLWNFGWIFLGILEFGVGILEFFFSSLLEILEFSVGILNFRLGILEFCLGVLEFP